MQYLNLINLRNMASYQSLINSLVSNLVFQAPLLSSTALARGTGSPTFTRAEMTGTGHAAGVAGYCQDYQGNWVALAPNVAPFEGARWTGSAWSEVDTNGVLLTTLKGYLSEPAATNVFVNSSAPVTQNISVTTANSGKWTTTIWGAGTVTTSAGTATATGYGIASVNSPNTITVTGNGTVTFTVVGADATTRVNVENAAFGTSWIYTGANACSRSATSLTYNQNQAAPLSMFAEYTPKYTPATSQMILSVTDNTSTNRINLLHSTTQARGLVGATGSCLVGTMVANTPCKVGLYADANILKAFKDGTGGTLDTSVTLPASTSQIDIGWQTSFAANVPCNIKNCRIYNKVLSDSQMAALTR